MAEDFGDSTGSGLVNTVGQAAKEVVQAVVTKGASEERAVAVSPSPGKPRT